MSRTKGSRNKPKEPGAAVKPRKPRSSRGPAPSAAQGRAQRQASADRSNGVDGEACAEILETLLANHDKRLSIMGEAMNACRGTHQADKELLADAKSSGQPVRALKYRFKEIILERKLAAVRGELEPDDQSLLDQVRDATRDALGGLADLPLGGAAVDDAARKASAAAEDQRRARFIGSIVGGGDPDAESAARNAEALTGIKQLN